MPQLLAIAERVDKLTAICVVCGEPATRTQRIVNGVPASYEDPLVIVGGAESYQGQLRSAEPVARGEAPGSGATRYEAPCRGCHEVPRRSLSPTG